jgi:hypothetical protein
MRHLRYMWIIAAAVLGGGVALAAASALAGLGPIALVCGVLLVWSGVVKVIVLRIWQANLPQDPVDEVPRTLVRSSTFTGR